MAFRTIRDYLLKKVFFNDVLLLHFDEGHMELYLRNVGIITDSMVQFDGLTVITGKNNSGKTTVGKVIYSIIQANSGVEEAFEAAKNYFFRSQLGKIWTTLIRRRHVQIRRMDGIDENNHVDFALYILSRPFLFFSSDSRTEYINLLGEVLPSLSYKDVEAFLNKYYSVERREEEYFQTLSEHFEAGFDFVSKEDIAHRDLVSDPSVWQEIRKYLQK